MYSVWVILFFYFRYTVALDEGCLLATKSLGTCQLFSNCTYAQDMLQSGKNPVVCGYTTNEAIVCCPIKLPPKTQSNSAQLTSSTDKPDKPLSDRKCEEFYPKPAAPILITGGLPSLAKEFPHMALIGYGNKSDIQWLCGGSLIDRKYVLTAAHCLQSQSGPAQWVRLGDLDLSTDDDIAEPQELSIIRRIPHPNYQHPVRYHDVALLELEKKAASSVFVSEACLNTKRDAQVEKMTASGWGKTDFLSSSSSYLLKVNLNRANSDTCKKAYAGTNKKLLPNGIDDETQICAGGVIGQDTCQGDSGGPLQVENPDRTFYVTVHTLIGITSFGKACGISPTPGIYTRISYYVPWIESIVWPGEK